MARPPIDVPTILDYLNEDCWHILLSYVPLEDIIRSEPVSRRWQKTVLTYLRGVRISIQCHQDPVYEAGGNVRRIQKPDFNNNRSFDDWIKKLGPSVVAIHFDSNNAMFATLRDNCPDLEALRLQNLQGPLSPGIRNEKFKCLQKLSIRKCKGITDQCVSQIIAGNDTLEELNIWKCLLDITGKFLSDVQSKNLKTLMLFYCYEVKAVNELLAAIDRFSNLTSLGLGHVSKEIFTKMPSLLAKTPKLEYLKIVDYNDHSYCYFAAISQLSRLKRLVFYVGYMTDEGMDTVTRSCEELVSLSVDGSELTRAGVRAVCRNAGARLESLDFGCCWLTDNNVVDIVSSCPKLTLLDVHDSERVTPALAARAAAARRGLRALRPPLRLRVPATGEHTDELYEGMKFDEVLIERVPE